MVTHILLIRAAEREGGPGEKAFMREARKNVVGVVKVFVYANRESITDYSAQTFTH